MTDRLVRPLAPVALRANLPKPFSAFLSTPNIVLLGDPGAGKTHLFRHFAFVEHARWLPTRAFLNLDIASLESSRIFFIDALDEKRAGRGDQSTIDRLVAKLCVLRPERVRIACRAADWLGAVDLTAFESYFELSGDHVVLALEPLSLDERVAVLEQANVDRAPDFLNEAENKGLHELLANPQSLIMLANVVRNGEWPENRSELFRLAVPILLAEHNAAHAQREGGKFTPHELLDAAGSLCAIRLLGDIDGISVSELDLGSELPTYRNIAIGDVHKAQAAIGRRVFVSGYMPGTVDYSHRTIAEYLGAHWLARQVRGGLPIGRVRALLGVNGHPASELRGLHAWIAISLPEHAAELIDADPFGVLSYGDAAVLGNGDRKHLIDALARLAQRDPWFRADDWSSSAVASLSGPDMTEHFRRVLADESSGFTLRSIVLDALTSGIPIPELQHDLETILRDDSVAYRERNMALEALRRLGTAGDAIVADVYPALSSSPDGLRLRATIINELYGTYFEAADVSSLLNSALACRHEIVGGAFWTLDVAIPISDIAEVLDQIQVPHSRLDGHADWRSVFEVLHVVDRLLARLLSENPDVSSDALWRWLRVRAEMQEQFGEVSGEELKAILASNAAVLARVAAVWLRELSVQVHAWADVHRFSRATLFALPDSQLLEQVVFVLTGQTGAKRAFLYEMALLIAFRIGPEALQTFEYLYDFASRDPELAPVREGTCVSTIEEWRIQQARRRQAAVIERENVRKKNRADFELARKEVSAGGHLGWLGWIASVYFCRHSGLSHEATAKGRLIAELGESFAATAVDALISFVGRAEITELPEVCRMAAAGRYFDWWYAVIAGLDEYVAAGHSVGTLPDAYLRAALAIDCVHPTHRQQGNTVHLLDHTWKRGILTARPEMARDAYLALARASFAAHTQHVHGLHELMQTNELQVFRGQTALLLLREFDTVKSFELRELLSAALGTDDHELRQLCITRAAQCAAEQRADCCSLWNAAAFLASGDVNYLTGGADATTRQYLVWALRDLIGSRSRGKGPQKALTVEQLEAVARLAGTEFPNAHHPSGSSSGDTNPWDAAELVRNIVNTLAANPLGPAGDALARLQAAPEMATYTDYIKHARAQQHSRAVDAQFRQPHWRDVVSVLANGRPANIADLHALVLAHFADIEISIASSNTDIFKRFWNEDSYGRVLKPKTEESCRDVLVDLLRARLTPHGVTVEPEGHMVADKRADIVAAVVGSKVVIELKRDYHDDVWRALHEQLDHFYTRDPEASGFGIYGVFWFGKKRPTGIPTPPGSLRKPESAEEMQRQLQSLVPLDKRSKVRVAVIDVAGS